MNRCYHCRTAIATGYEIKREGRYYHGPCYSAVEISKFVQDEEDNAEEGLTREELALEAYRAGWRTSVRLYAVWKDGEQWVGVQRKPLQGVLNLGPDEYEERATVQRLLKQ